MLIDTQALIWLNNDSPRMSASALRLLETAKTQRFASVVSIWEMAIKLPLGKLTLNCGSLERFVGLLAENRIALLPVVVDDALHVERLPQGPHKDPFDRLIAAQCLRRDLTLVSADAAFDTYGVRRVW